MPNARGEGVFNNRIYRIKATKCFNRVRLGWFTQTVYQSCKFHRQT